MAFGALRGVGVVVQQLQTPQWNCHVSVLVLEWPVGERQGSSFPCGPLRPAAPPPAGVAVQWCGAQVGVPLPLLLAGSTHGHGPWHLMGGVVVAVCAEMASAGDSAARRRGGVAVRPSATTNLPLPMPASRGATAAPDRRGAHQRSAPQRLPLGIYTDLASSVYLLPPDPAVGPPPLPSRGAHASAQPCAVREGGGSTLTGPRCSEPNPQPRRSVRTAPSAPAHAGT